MTWKAVALIVFVSICNILLNLFANYLTGSRPDLATIFKSPLFYAAFVTGMLSFSTMIAAYWFLKGGDAETFALGVLLMGTVSIIGGTFLGLVIKIFKEGWETFSRFTQFDFLIVVLLLVLFVLRWIKVLGTHSGT